MEALSGPRHHQVYSKLKAWGLKPLVLDFYMQRIWSTFSLERILARVSGLRPESSVATTIRLSPNFNFKNFHAGQHVLITASVNGHRLTRTYSPTLLHDGSLEITVKAIEGGKLSSYLARGMKRGATVEISEAFGEMTWANIPVAQHYVLCAGGVGITPLRSLIHAWSQGAVPGSKIELHYWAKKDSEFCFREELVDLSRQHTGLRLHFYTSALKVSPQDMIPTANHALVLACGPASFVQAARLVAEKNQQKFIGEHAQVSPIASAQNKETFYDLNYDGQVIRASSQKTILESLEANGLQPAQGCRMGLCKSCTCMKVSGASFSSRNQELNAEPNEEIQICVASPRSSIKLEKY